MFQDAFLHLFQAVMILVQGLFGIHDAQVIGGIYPPRQSQQGLQISKLHIVIGRLRIDAFQLGYLLFKKLGHFLAPLIFGTLCTQFFHFAILSATQLILNVLDLLLQEVFALLAIDVLACTHLDRLFDISQTHFAVQYLNQAVHTVFQIRTFQ